MNKPRLIISGLALSFVVLLFAAVGTKSVSAGLGCWQIRSCSGDAGCGGGSVEGCIIYCNSGSTIFCNLG